MQRKRYENILFLVVIIIMLAYSLILIPSTDIDKTGKAYTQDEKPLTDSIYEFLTLVKNYPDEYMVVIGTYAKDYEIKYAEEITANFGIVSRYEEDIDIANKLIIIGAPNTNLLIGDLLTTEYAEDEALAVMKGNNLLIVVNNEQQAEKISKIINGFREERERLAPNTLRVGFGWVPLYFTAPFLIVIAILLFFVEKHRKKSIEKAQETKEEHKLQNIEKYIKKYSTEGHSKEQIKNWLINYGYKEELVDKAMAGIKNA